MIAADGPLSNTVEHIGKRSVVQCLNRCSLELKAANALHAGNGIGDAMRGLDGTGGYAAVVVGRTRKGEAAFSSSSIR